jgi:mono/diheme cytochrome c family protein
MTRLPVFLLIAAALPAAAAPVFQDHVLPIFREHCNSCHNPDKLKADLDLTTYETTMKGGSSGNAIAGTSADTSLLYRVVAHLDEPEMPPKKPKLPDEALATIKAWIEGGSLPTVGGTAAKSRDAALAMALPTASVTPDGPPPLPESVPAAPAGLLDKASPVTTLAASPRAPLLALPRNQSIALLDSTTGASLGALPFPERSAAVLRFSRDGTLLLAAGGRGAHSGKAVVFDIKTGKRLIEAGGEASDAILAADLSPDRQLLATGGPDKIIRIYSATDGSVLRSIKKHTDWVTALAFSPDGEKLATADRNGGLHLWDPKTGTILFTLAEHQARITSLAWRADSVVLASAGDDGKLVLWDTSEGFAARSLSPHDAVKKDEPGRRTMLLKIPGILSADIAADGRLLTAGRDNTVRLFSATGSLLTVIKDFTELPTVAVFLNDPNSLATGDFLGQLKRRQTKDKTATGTAILH